jgi:hypothetical protein
MEFTLMHEKRKSMNSKTTPRNAVLSVKFENRKITRSDENSAAALRSDFINRKRHLIWKSTTKRNKDAPIAPSSLRTSK